MRSKHNILAKFIDIHTNKDIRGNLSVIEDFQVPFDIKRFFYIYGAENSMRGCHRHHTTHQLVICLVGSCKIYNNDGKIQETFLLDSPKKALHLEPKDWHSMYDFSKDAILLVIASENFNAKDYIFERYEGDSFS